MVEQALKKHAYNISLAAAELGLTRASLYRRMEKHGLVGATLSASAFDGGAFMFGLPGGSR